MILSMEGLSGLIVIGAVLYIMGMTLGAGLVWWWDVHGKKEEGRN
jgi:hypothetical protein